MADETGLSPLVPAVHPSAKRKGKGKHHKMMEESEMTMVTIDPPSRTQYNLAPTPSNVVVVDEGDGDGMGLMKVPVNHSLSDLNLNQQDSEGKKDFLEMLDAAADLAAMSYAAHAMAENVTNRECTPVDDRLCSDHLYKGDKRTKVIHLAKQFMADFDEFRKATEVNIEETMPERVMRRFAEFLLSGINMIATRKEEDYAEGYMKQYKDRAISFIKSSDRYLKLKGPTAEQISVGRDFIDGIIRLNLVEASTPIIFTVRPSPLAATEANPHHHHPRLRAYVDVKRYGVLVPKIIWREIESIFYYESSRRIAFLNAMRIRDEDVIDLERASLLCQRLALERDTFGYIAAQYNSAVAPSSHPSLPTTTTTIPSSDADLEMATLSSSSSPPPPPVHMLSTTDPSVVETIERTFANHTGSDLRSEIVRRALYFFRCYYNNAMMTSTTSVDSNSSGAEASTANNNLNDYVLLTMRHMDPFIKLDKLSSTSPRAEPHMPRESFVIQTDAHQMHRMSAILYHALAVYCVMDLECEKVTTMSTWTSAFGDIPDKYKNSMESKILDDINLTNEEQSVKAMRDDDAMIAFHALIDMPPEYWIVAPQTRAVCDMDGQYWFNVVYQDAANEITIKKGSKRRHLSDATSWVALEGTWHYLSTLIK